MTAITVSCHIDAPVERVFELASDLPNAAERIDDITKIEMMTEGPVGVGTRFRETRIMFKKECTEEMEINEFVPNERYATVAGSHGCTYRAEFVFTPEGGGTLVAMNFESTAHTFMAKIMSVMFKFMTGTMVKCVQRDLECIKKHAEQGAAAAS